MLLLGGTALLLCALPNCMSGRAQKRRLPENQENPLDAEEKVPGEPPAVVEESLFKRDDQKKLLIVSSQMDLGDNHRQSCEQICEYFEENGFQWAAIEDKRIGPCRRCEAGTWQSRIIEDEETHAKETYELELENARNDECWCEGTGWAQGITYADLQKGVKDLGRSAKTGDVLTLYYTGHSGLGLCNSEDDFEMTKLPLLARSVAYFTSPEQRQKLCGGIWIDNSNPDSSCSGFLVYRNKQERLYTELKKDLLSSIPVDAEDVTVIVILDTCFSEQACPLRYKLDHKTGLWRDSQVGTEKESDKKPLVITLAACKALETSALSPGIFTSNLIEVLDKAKTEHETAFYWLKYMRAMIKQYRLKMTFREGIFYEPDSDEEPTSNPLKSLWKTICKPFKHLSTDYRQHSMVMTNNIGWISRI